MRAIARSNLQVSNRYEFSNIKLSMLSFGEIFKTCIQADFLKTNPVHLLSIATKVEKHNPFQLTVNLIYSSAWLNTAKLLNYLRYSAIEVQYLHSRHS